MNRAVFLDRDGVINELDNRFPVHCGAAEALPVDRRSH